MSISRQKLLSDKALKDVEESIPIASNPEWEDFSDEKVKALTVLAGNGNPGEALCSQQQRILCNLLQVRKRKLSVKIRNKIYITSLLI